MIENLLTKLGFHKNTIKVYLSLFELGKVRAGKIIEHTGLHRNLVYTSLDDLIKRELVSKVIKNGVAMFEANSPHALVEQIDKQKNIAEEAAGELKKKQTETPRDIKVFEGLDGMMEARTRSLALPPGETLYVIGGSAVSSSPAFESRWISYHKKRAKKGINLKILYDRTAPQENLDARNKMEHSEAKYLPFDIDMPAFFEAFGDVMSIGIGGDDPLVFSVRNKRAADGIKSFCNYFWNQNATVTRGTKAVSDAFYGMINEMNPGEEYFVLGGNFGLMSKTWNFFEKYHSDRVKKGVVANILADNSAYGKLNNLFAVIDKENKFSRVKKFPISAFSPVQINLYNNKAVIVIYDENPTVITIDQKEVYNNFKNYFDELWGQDTYVAKGPEVLRDIWLESIDDGGIKFIGARGYFMDRYPKLMEPILEKMKKSKNVYWQNICDPSMKGHPVTKFPWSQTKYTSANPKNLNVIWLWGKKAAVVNWAENEPIILITENKYLVQSYSDYFDELWG